MPQRAKRSPCRPEGLWYRVESGKRADIGPPFLAQPGTYLLLRVGFQIGIGTQRRTRRPMERTGSLPGNARLRAGRSLGRPD